MATKAATTTAPAKKGTSAKATASTKPAAKTSTAAKAEKPAKAKKEQPAGYTTAQAAEILSERLGKDITPTSLRRVLRSDDGGHNDKGYTRYALTDDEINRLEGIIKAGGTAASDGTKKRGRKAKAEAPEGEVPEELEALDEDEEVVEELGEDDESEDEDEAEAESDDEDEAEELEDLEDEDEEEDDSDESDDEDDDEE